ncbi:hypothetical protein LDENG_00048400 [Lucifuga dentata]|nr:hypothetical protein LDENG_00048400 [Lucifuga dentata]
MGVFLLQLPHAVCEYTYLLYKVCLTAAVPTSKQVSGARLTSLSWSHIKETRDGLKGYGVLGWPARLLLPWALGAGKLGLELCEIKVGGLRRTKRDFKRLSHCR